MYNVRAHGCYSHCRSRGRIYCIRDVFGRFREKTRQLKDSLILSTIPVPPVAIFLRRHSKMPCRRMSPLLNSSALE